MGDRFAATLESAKAGDEAAFAQLFEALAPFLGRYLRVLAPNVAEDLAGDTWLDVVRNLPAFSGGEGAFRAWIITIARRRYVDWCRSQSRRPLGLYRDIPDRADDEADPALSAEQEAATQDALRLIATLPCDQAEVVMLRVVVGLDVAAVAKVMGRRPGAVRTLAHRGLRTLAQRLPRRSGVLEV